MAVHYPRGHALTPSNNRQNNETGEEYLEAAKKQFTLKNENGEARFYLNVDAPYNFDDEATFDAMYELAHQSGGTFAFLELSKHALMNYYQYTVDRNSKVIEYLTPDFSTDQNLKNQLNTIFGQLSNVDQVDFSPNSQEMQYLTVVAGLLIMLANSGKLEKDDIQAFLNLVAKLEEGATTISPNEAGVLLDGLTIVEPVLWHGSNNPTALGQNTETTQRKIEGLSNRPF